MSQDRAFTIGVVGCGRISQHHFDAIAKVDGLSLGAVCDIDEARAKAAGIERGVPSFTSVEELVKLANIDVVAVCTPSGLHPDHGIIAAKAGKHVISEKPM